MGPVRAEVMRQSVLDAVSLAGGDDRPLTILDVGGGTGGDAVRLAERGHAVTVVDPSPDALAALQRRATESSASVNGVLGDAADLHEQVENASVDLVICHGVLEVVDDPADAIAGVARVLRRGGYVSVVVGGRRSAVVARALAGDFVGAARVLSSDASSWDVREQGPRRFVPEEVDALLATQGLTVEARYALRVFADLVPGALVDIEPGARDALFALERTIRDDPSFAALAVGLQSIARLDL